MWSCEFCGHQNSLDLEQEELPKSEQEHCQFVLEAPPKADEKSKEKEKAQTPPVIVFCIGTRLCLCLFACILSLVAGSALCFLLTSVVVSCADISGSMCVTTEVPGHVDLSARLPSRAVDEDVRALSGGVNQVCV